jgi:hypothetical protein
MENKGSFIRWQAITINQLSLATNVILTFTVALIGFEINFLLNLNKDFPKFGCYFKVSYLASLTLLFFSFLLAILLIVNRLKDFRLTAKSARLREEIEKIDIDEENYQQSKDEKLTERLELKAKTKKLGERTWCLFNWQLGTFSLAMILAVISFFNLILSRIG